MEPLADALDLTIGNTSQHLQHLRHAGLVTARRDGRQIIYCLTDELIVTLMKLMGEVTRLSIQLKERDTQIQAPLTPSKPPIRATVSSKQPASYTPGATRT